MPAGAGEDHRLATVIFPENPVSRQAESDRFRKRDCLACDPAITGQPLSGGSLTRRGDMVVEQLRRAVEASPRVELARVAHPLLPLHRPPFALRRGSRQPFAPSKGGVYRLPHGVRDRLTGALTAYRNRDAAFALAVFLARYWSTPARLLTAFPIDRRELAEHAALDLTEARVRGAIRTLEEVGFLDRAVTSGSTHKPTPDGLHRNPV